MLRKFANWVHHKERSLHRATGNDISTPETRKAAWRHYLWLDHGVLRFWWKNEAEIAPGVFRSNHPHHARLERFKAKGVRTVLSLRGKTEKSPYLFEAESCKTLGLDLVFAPLGAREFATRARFIAVLDAFETIPKPFVMHCKSGADRTGLASAMYLLTYCDATDEEARAQLTFRYLHIRKSATGRLDFLLENYLKQRATTGLDLRTWITDVYDPDALAKAYGAQKATQRFWRGW